MHVLHGIVFYFLACHYFVISQDIKCNYTDYGTLCLTETRNEVVKVIDNNGLFDKQLLVGTTDALQVLTLDFELGLQFEETISLPSRQALINNCSLLWAVICRNTIYIFTIVPLPDGFNSTLVCGSNAYYPQCTVQ